MKKKIIIVSILISVFIVAYFFYNNEGEEIIIKPIAKEVVAESEKCFVDVKGEVVNPGVYECVNNDKVIDMINKAGGLTKNANTSVLNLSKIVSNEMLIIVYSNKQINDAIIRLNEPTVIEIIKEVEKECVCPDSVNNACEFTSNEDESNTVNEESNNTTEESNNKVNINEASIEVLMTLSGIGETKAKAIIAYRNENKFESIQDIMKVSGIGESTFNGIKDFIEI